MSKRTYYILCGPQCVCRGLVKAGVYAPKSQQLLVRALLTDAPLVQHQNPHRPLRSREPVGNDQSGAAAGQPFQRLLHYLLAVGVQRAGGLVENQDRRVFQEHPGNGEPLTGKPPMENSMQLGLV